jgi:hypothetical protein
MSANTIDLNALDPRNIKFQFGPSENYGGGYAVIMTTTVTHDTNILLEFFGQLNLERLQRGWTLIYSKYCKGKQKAF